MPWSETVEMSRVKFIADLGSYLYDMTQLCEKHGISRKTGYKWAERFVQEGVEGLKDRSRAPKYSPRQTKPEVAVRLLELRRQHPTWGPRKLLAWLEKHEPGQGWPGASTVGGVLKRAGLAGACRRRAARARAEIPAARTEPRSPNEVWTSDFKGEFRTGDGRLCYPLTVVDGFSRFVLAIQGLPSVATAGAWPVFEQAFREYGLPQVIRTDNGNPFARSSALAGLSRLSVRWIKLGIVLERIEPGHPEQNGRHERMHRTLKAETARPPAANARIQQELFDRFRQEYNEQRPHEALGQRPPSELYQPSRRRYPDRLPPPEYPGHFEVRSVARGGEIKWRGEFLFLSAALSGERVGLEEYEDGLWAVYFGTLQLGRFDERERKIYG
ncbi:MAG TPA: IS481 family transposase [Thermoanaerobaculia bacterium]|jgi:transposase InsO family protein|nr:IS481 family transposase [Thermoanaerobaculia bacterium]